MTARDTSPSFVLMVLAPPLAMAGLVAALRLSGWTDAAPLLLILPLCPAALGVWQLPMRTGFRLLLMPAYLVTAAAVLFVGSALVACHYGPCY